MKALSLSLSFSFVLLLVSPVFAFPQLLSIDGYLTNSSGSARNGSYPFVFGLYTAPSGGSALWTETQTLAVSSGKLNALLGSVTALNLPFDQDYYLGVNVNSDGEMLPRYRISASAYAYTAKALAPGDVNVTGDFNYGCPNTSTNQMVKVGSFCIDKYEAHIASGSLGNANGNDTTAVAGSKPGVDPQGAITWFQAEQACLNAGKRLCSNQEWQGAVAGTPDPGATGSSTSCNVASNTGSGTYADASGTPANTGAHTACVSRWGVYDLVGNVGEWVADWGQAGMTWETASGQTAAPWPAGYGSDLTWNVNGQVSNGTANVNGAPGAFVRGGSWENGADAGSFALALQSAPSRSYPGFGFRCCKQ